MIGLESRSSDKKSKRIGTTIKFVFALSVAVLVLSAVSYGAKLPPTTLSPVICTKIGGAWTGNACVIEAGTNGVANQPFTVTNGVTLDVKGSLTINKDVTVGIANSGHMIVENMDGITQPVFDSWKTGVLVYGTLANSGNITIANTWDGTVRNVGITIWDSAIDYENPTTFVFGTLTNSGTINIQNMGQTRGIENLGTLTNTANGTITIANNGDSNYCVGIYTRRAGGPFVGNLINLGTITISNSGDDSFGLYTAGFLTNSGVLTVNALIGNNATGIWNEGSFTQTSTGKYTNNQGILDPLNPESSSTWGNFNNSGTMINYGTTWVNGTFLTIGYTMINFGTIYSSSTGAMVEYGGSMLNYGTIRNSGTIIGGKNYYICIDVPPTGNGC